MLYFIHTIDVKILKLYIENYHLSLRFHEKHILEFSFTKLIPIISIFEKELKFEITFK